MQNILELKAGIRSEQSMYVVWHHNDISAIESLAMKKEH